MKEVKTTVKLSTLKRNPKNPRIIRDDAFKSLVESIRAFPDMMKVRPIVVDENNMIYGGDKRYLALLDLGYKEVPHEYVKKMSDFSPEQWKEFTIKDNTHFGSWDWEMLGNDFDDSPLDDWGLSTGFAPKTDPEFDTTQVTPEAVERKKGEMTEVDAHGATAIEVTCPHCGKDFRVK